MIGDALFPCPILPGTARNIIRVLEESSDG